MPGVLHWGPLVAITIISVVTVTSTYSALQLWSLPRSVVMQVLQRHTLRSHVHIHLADTDLLELL